MKNPLLAAVLLASTCAVRAEMVAVAWDGADRFRTAAAVGAGKMLEACATLGAGESVAWSFESAAPLEFNVHYHEGRKVVFPVESHATAGASGTLVAPVRHDYCWMWTNRGAAASQLTLTLQKTAR